MIKTILKWLWLLDNIVVDVNIDKIDIDVLFNSEKQAAEFYKFLMKWYIINLNKVKDAETYHRLDAINNVLVDFRNAAKSKWVELQHITDPQDKL